MSTFIQQLKVKLGTAVYAKLKPVVKNSSIPSNSKLNWFANGAATISIVWLACTPSTI